MYNLTQIEPHAGQEARPRNAPIADHADAVERHKSLHRAFVQARGGWAEKDGRVVPRTTNADVMHLATLWSRELMKVEPKGEADHTERKRWSGCMNTVAKLADLAQPDERYQKNASFWHQCTWKLAVYLKSRKIVPSRWALFRDTVIGAVAEIPGAVGIAGQAAAGAVGTAAKAAMSNPAMAAMAILGGVLLLPPVIRAVRE